MKLKLENTFSRKVESFEPISPKEVSFYSCGPTVYDYTHIGHLRKFTMDDLLVRSLKYLGFGVKHVMNITDVGHLVGDETESGEDKLEKGSRATGKTAYEVASFFTVDFLENLKKMKIHSPTILCKATDHIPQMIALIKNLEKNGFTYKTSEALYFDISKFARYGALSGQKLTDKLEGVRSEVKIDKDKKNPSDFALWFFVVGRFADHQMHWASPWGEGFPGWHIECSAMSMHYLGEQIDIHSGGIDHIPVHHENEIAQSEGATGKSPFVKYWLHYNMLSINGDKMSKSLQNFTRLTDLEKLGFTGTQLRYLFLQTHYSSELNFSLDALQASKTALFRLKNSISNLQKTDKIDDLSVENDYENEFQKAICDNLNFPKALALLWEVVKSDISNSQKISLIEKFDTVLGLDLLNFEDKLLIPENILELANMRLEAKKNGDFVKSDLIRNQINTHGYNILDSNGSFEITKK